MTSPCRHGASCQNTNGSYRCHCRAGYTGRNCETDIDDCRPSEWPDQLSPSDTGREPVEPEGRTGVAGSRSRGGAGRTSCHPGVAEPGGSDTAWFQDGEIGLPISPRLSPVAPPPTKEPGPVWPSSRPPGAPWPPHPCLPLRPALRPSPDPCHNGGSCTDGINMAFCDCQPGFQGAFCEEDINECASNPCHHGANCTDCVASYTCTCPAGFSGIHCENNTPDCTERWAGLRPEGGDSEPGWRGAGGACCSGEGDGPPGLGTGSGPGAPNGCPLATLSRPGCQTLCIVLRGSS